MGDHMPRRKKTVDVESTKEKVDKEMSSMGLTYQKVIGIIILIIGVVLLVVNLVHVLEAFVGLVLIYFGLRMFGYTIKL
jgi:uncharacterized integral membrane protein